VAAFLIPYAAVAVVMVMVWALACLMYGAVRTDTSAKLTFLAGLVILVLPAVVAGIVMR
jgi:hypothetical protein